MALLELQFLNFRNNWSCEKFSQWQNCTIPTILLIHTNFSVPWKKHFCYFCIFRVTPSSFVLTGLHLFVLYRVYVLLLTDAGQYITNMKHVARWDSRSTSNFFSATIPLIFNVGVISQVITILVYTDRWHYVSNRIKQTATYFLIYKPKQE